MPFLHLHRGQIASRSKTNVPARGLLHDKNLIPLRNGMSGCATVDGWATVWNTYTDPYIQNHANLATWQTECCTPRRMAFKALLNAKAALS